MRTLSLRTSALALAGFSLWGSIAAAKTIEQTQSFSGYPTYHSDLTFNRFNPALGTLNSVWIQSSLTVNGSELLLDNDSSSPAEGDLVTGADLSITQKDTDNDPRISSSVNSLAVHQTTHVTVGANDGDGAGFQNKLGSADYGYVAPLVNMTTTNSAYMSSSWRADYTGTDSFTFVANTYQGLNWGQLGGVAYQGTPLTAQGYVKIVYDYTPIPEPVLMGGLVSAFVGLGFRRRVA